MFVVLVVLVVMGRTVTDHPSLAELNSSLFSLDAVRKSLLLEHENNPIKKGILKRITVPFQLIRRSLS
jgi:hypothetical protein